MTADDDVTITVSRADLERVVYCAWEPSDEQLCIFMAWGTAAHGTWVDRLKALHAAGLRLP